MNLGDSNCTFCYRDRTWLWQFNVKEVNATSISVSIFNAVVLRTVSLTDKERSEGIGTVKERSYSDYWVKAVITFDQDPAVFTVIRTNRVGGYSYEEEIIKRIGRTVIVTLTDRKFCFNVTLIRTCFTRSNYRNSSFTRRLCSQATNGDRLCSVNRIREEAKVYRSKRTVVHLAIGGSGSPHRDITTRYFSLYPPLIIAWVRWRTVIVTNRWSNLHD